MIRSRIVSDIRLAIVDAGGAGIDRREQIFRGGRQFYPTICDLHVRVRIRIFRTVVNSRYILRKVHQKQAAKVCRFMFGRKH